MTGERVGIVGDQKTLYDNDRDSNDQDTSLPYLVYRQIRSYILACAEYSKVTLTDAEIASIISKCFEMIGNTRAQITSDVEKILVEGYGLSRAYVVEHTKWDIYSSIIQITWTNTTTIQTGIGQSITTVTPIAVARYLSALVNGGYVYDTHIVDKVTTATGELVYEQQPTLVRKLDVNQDNLNTIMKGMRDMVNESEDHYSSTARRYFNAFKYKNQLGGKTGTAQVSDINLEDNAWFVAFAPYDDPEIAIVVYIPNGFSGSMASATVKDIAEYYLDLKYAVEDDSLPADNTILY